MKKILLTAVLCSTFILGKGQNFSGSFLSCTHLSSDVGDLDGDGDLDIITGGMRQLSWEENVAPNVFVNHAIAHNQMEVQGVVMIDLDQDGYQDIVSASLSNNAIYWNRNNGNNVFSSNIIATGATGPAGIDAADMDNDGDIDIVFAAFTGDKFSWLQNNGSQTFTLINVSTNHDGALRVRCADADNDGDVDIFAAARESGRFLLFTNNGSGSFTQVTINSSFSMPRDIRDVDFDLDGDIDFLYCGGGGYGWYRNDGNAFTQQQIWSFGSMYGINYGDLNNNGEWDIVLANYADENITSILDVVNDGTEGDMVNSWVDYASMVHIHDFNGDGKQDVVCAGSYDVKLALNINGTTFNELPINKTLNDIRSAAHGDFDNDGDIDLIGIGYLNIFWFRNENNGEFTPIRMADAETYGWITVEDGEYIRAGDIDGDGDTDAVFSESNSDMVYWLENDGNGDFILHEAFYHLGVYSLDLTDFDGDDDLDILATDVGTSSISWFENNGNATNWIEHSVNYTNWYPFQAVAVDYDDDGYMDVLAAHAGNSDEVIVYINEGDNESFIERVIDSDAPGANSVYYTDIDSDGDLDILAAISESNRVNLYRSNGASYPIYTEIAIATSIETVTYVYADDYDNDGDIDVVCSSLTDKDIDVLINDGSENFTRIGLNTYADDAQFVESGDLDNDGIPEIYGVAGDYGVLEVFKLTPYLPPPPVDIADCSELFFSEYVEGSSYNKVLEIYNPTSAAVNLTGYKVEVYSNGATSASQTVNLSGTIAAHDVFVITTSLADLDFYFAAELIFGLNFNGDDAIVLSRNGEIIDVIGVIGQDPGTAWTGAGGSSTLDKTLVRKATVTKGNNTGAQVFDPSIEWDVYNVDNPFFIDFHDGICNDACVASIVIAASSNDICEGLPVSFTATTTNEGSNPIFQWKKNGNNVGSNTSIYNDSALNDNDIVTCTLTTNESCALNNTVTSNSIAINVNSSANPTINITSTATSICSGTLVTFNASVTNAGSNPIYQWKKNGNNVGTNTSVYAVSNLVNGDQITCTLTSNAPCISVTQVVSNTITINITSAVSPSVVISVPVTSICSGSSVTFTASATNGGNSPTYQWKKNGNNVGTNSSTYTISNLINGDIITCVMTSNASCLTSTTATSNAITMSVTNGVTPSLWLNPSTTTPCANELVIFNAFPQNGGTSPSYIWYQDGQIVNTNGNAYSGSNWTNGTQVYVTMTSSATCANPVTVASNVVTLTVSSAITPSISITANQTSICAGSSVTFTAVPVNGGTTPSYQWKKNGNNVGGNSTTYTSSSLVNGDQITCVLTTSIACPSAATATSNAITMNVSSSVTPSVSISANQTSICSGTMVTFVATPVNGGTSPSYQWKKNGNNSGTNSPNYTSSTLVNGDIITCVMTSNAACVTTANSTSNAITMSVSTSVTPSVSISAGSTNICQNTAVTFNASPQAPGTSPIYTWYKNGQIVGSNSTAYSTSTLTTGDQVYVVLTSNANCATQNNATSNTITVTVSPQVTPSCVITTPNTSICSGTNVNFVATPINGGSSPTFQWKKNGNNVGANSNTYSTNTLQDGEMITCVLTSNAACPTSATVNSNTITMNVTVTVSPTITISSSGNTICSGESVEFNATITNGGNNPQYQWKVNNQNFGENSDTFISSTLENGDVIQCVLISNATCVSPSSAQSNNITVNVSNPVTPFVSITSTAMEVCSNDPFEITANPTYPGSNPVFVWYQNGDIVSTTGPSLLFQNLDQTSDFYVTMISNEACATETTVSSSILNIALAENLIASVTISPSSSGICSGENVIFNAFTENGGINPSYQWTKNGNSVGSNSPQYASSILQNGDMIACTMISSSNCVAAAVAESNVIEMTVTPSVVPSVSINTVTNVVCENETVLFISSGQNAGEDPSIQWLVNGEIQGDGSSFILTNPQDQDHVFCLMTSSEVCATLEEVSSNEITVEVLPMVQPSVTISTVETEICSEHEILIESAIENGGTAPTFNWYLNGQLTDEHSTSWTTNTLQNGDQVICEMNSNASCAISQLAESNSLQFTVVQLAIPVISEIGNELTIPTIMNATYQWYLGSEVIEGATTNVLVPTANGEYYGEITLGPCIQMSEPFIITDIGIDEWPDLLVSIYPNPTKNLVYISPRHENMSIIVTDVTGNTLRIIQGSVVDLTELSNGIYTLEIQFDRYSFKRTLIKSE
jgi:hypothetical protein